MATRSRVWWWAAKGYWATQIDGKRILLAKGRRNKKVAQTKHDRILKERELLASVDGPISVAALCEQFLVDAHKHLAVKTYESYRYACQMFVDQYADRAAHGIRPLDIRRFTQWMDQSLSETTQGIVLRSLLRCFNWGVAEELIPQHSLSKIRKPTGVRRDRYLSDEEFRQLLRGTNPRNNHRRGAEFRRLLLAMDWTLCRPGELTRLKWEYIRWEQRVAILDDHKTRRATGKSKVIALVPKMIRLLRWLQERTASEFVFVNSRGEPWTVNAVNQRVQHIRERADLDNDVIPYTIRHRAATNAILRTGDLKLTSLLLGHTSTHTTERYTHIAQQHLVSFADRAVDGR